MDLVRGRVDGGGITTEDLLPAAVRLIRERLATGEQLTSDFLRGIGAYGTYGPPDEDAAASPPNRNGLGLESGNVLGISVTSRPGPFLDAARAGIEQALREGSLTRASDIAARFPTATNPETVMRFRADILLAEINESGFDASFIVDVRPSPDRGWQIGSGISLMNDGVAPTVFTQAEREVLRAGMRDPAFSWLRIFRSYYELAFRPTDRRTRERDQRILSRIEEALGWTREDRLFVLKKIFSEWVDNIPGFEEWADSALGFDGERNDPQRLLNAAKAIASQLKINDLRIDELDQTVAETLRERGSASGGLARIGAFAAGFRSRETGPLAPTELRKIALEHVRELYRLYNGLDILTDEGVPPYFRQLRISEAEIINAAQDGIEASALAGSDQRSSGNVLPEYDLDADRLLAARTRSIERMLGLDAPNQTGKLIIYHELLARLLEGDGFDKTVLPEFGEDWFRRLVQNGELRAALLVGLFAGQGESEIYPDLLYALRHFVEEGEATFDAVENILPFLIDWSAAQVLHGETGSLEDLLTQREFIGPFWRLCEEAVTDVRSAERVLRLLRLIAPFFKKMAENDLGRTSPESVLEKLTRQFVRAADPVLLEDVPLPESKRANETRRATPALFSSIANAWPHAVMTLYGPATRPDLLEELSLLHIDHPLRARIREILAKAT